MATSNPQASRSLRPVQNDLPRWDQTGYILGAIRREARWYVGNGPVPRGFWYWTRALNDARSFKTPELARAWISEVIPEEKAKENGTQIKILRYNASIEVEAVEVCLRIELVPESEVTLQTPPIEQPGKRRVRIPLTRIVEVKTA